MCKLFENWSKDIEQYCAANDLSFVKARSMAQCWGKDFLALQFYDPQKGQAGLRDETPAPLVLLITKTEQGLQFQQTEHTRRYLS